MSAFTPTRLEHLDAPDRPDGLTAAAVTALQRPAGHKAAWSTGRTIVIGLLSGGLGPMLLLPLKFRKFAALEQQQYRHAADWLALRGADGGAEARAAADHLDPGRAWAFVTCACAAAAVGSAAAFAVGGDHGWADVLAFVYLPAAGGGLGAVDEFAGLDVPLRLAYLLAVSAGYLSNLWQVNRHARAAGDFLLAFDAADGSGDRSDDAGRAATPLKRPGFQVGLRAGPVVAGLALAVAGVLWGVPMMLAAGAQARYVWTTGGRSRRSLARRLRVRAEADRPAIDVPRPAFHDGACGAAKCLAPLPPDARFCPRCGRRTVGPLNRVA